jgi:hypothetical protein
MSSAPRIAVAMHGSPRWLAELEEAPDRAFCGSGQGSYRLAWRWRRTAARMIKAATTTASAISRYSE